MVYGCAYWSKKVDDSIPKGFRDSKQMKEEGNLVCVLFICIPMFVIVAYFDFNDPLIVSETHQLLLQRGINFSKN